MTAQVDMGMLGQYSHSLNFRVFYFPELYATHGASEAWGMDKGTLWGWVRYKYSEGGFMLPYYKVVVSAY